MCGCSNFVGEEKESNPFEIAGIGMMGFMLIATGVLLWYILRK